MNSHIKKFKYVDLDGDDVELIVYLESLHATAWGTLYDFNGNMISRKKCLGSWCGNNKTKFLNALANNVGNMGKETQKRYDKFVEEVKEALFHEI